MEREEENFEQKLYGIENEIHKHYDRLQRLEKDVIVGAEEQATGGVWDKIKQLQDYRRTIKEEQKEVINLTYIIRQEKNMRR